MSKYHKIQTVWLRDPLTNHKTLLENKWAKPEFEYLADNEWTFTEKVDGTNIRLVRDDLSIRGKTDNAQLHGGLVQACRKIVELPAFSQLPAGMILYGEGYGAGIQKGTGKNYRSDQSFVLFDAWCNIWLDRSSIEEIATQLNIDIVPIIGYGTLNNMIYFCREKLYSKWGDFEAEGIVARPYTELTNRFGERVITKLKNKDFI